MTGLQDYDVIYQNKINGIINNNSDLQGYYYFISSSSSLSTIYSYLTYVKKFIDVTGKPVELLNGNDFINYIAKFNAVSKNGKRYSSSYKIDIYQALKSFENYLVATFKIQNSIMNTIKRPKNIESQETIVKRENGYLNEKEVNIYLNTIQKLADPNWLERDMSIILIFINTGIRASALYKLDIKDIDFYEKSLIVTDKEQKVYKKMLSDNTLSWINQWIKRREELLDGRELDALFISNRKTRISSHAISNIVIKYSCDIHGKKITPHKLRATYGTYIYKKTRDIYFTQQCMNHSNPETTALYIRGEKNNMEEKSRQLINNLFLSN